LRERAKAEAGKVRREVAKAATARKEALRAEEAKTKAMEAARAEEPRGGAPLRRLKRESDLRTWVPSPPLPSLYPSLLDWRSDQGWTQYVSPLAPRVSSHGAAHLAFLARDALGVPSYAWSGARCLCLLPWLLSPSPFLFLFRGPLLLCLGPTLGRDRADKGGAASPSYRHCSSRGLNGGRVGAPGGGPTRVQRVDAPMAPALWPCEVRMLWGWALSKRRRGGQGSGRVLPAGAWVLLLGAVLTPTANGLMGYAPGGSAWEAVR
jgi:hypothetical protein